MQRLILTASLILGLFAGTAEAGFRIQTPNVDPVAAGTTGLFFDVVLTNTGDAPVQNYQLLAYDIRIGISGASGVTFTNVTENSPGYAFASNNFGILVTSSPPLTISWNDAAIFDVPIATGESVTLGRVHFDVSTAATAGTYELSIQTPFTNLSDETFSPVSYQVSNGSIEITNNSVNPVPLPHSFWLSLIGAICGLILYRMT
jgi:hypothetical protein